MDELWAHAFEIIAGLAALFGKGIKIAPKKEYEKITRIVGIIPWLYLTIDIITNIIGIDFVFSVLRLLHKYPPITFIYIVVIAMLSPITAYYERKKCCFEADTSYIPLTSLFNAAGAAAACLMFALAHSIIPDFTVLKRFQIEKLVPVFISMSFILVFLYQSAEQSIKEKAASINHDPSIKWINQKINMLHLFNAYFVPVISAVYIITYTIYCRLYHITLVMDGKYILFLVITLLYFYILSMHSYEYLYKLFLIVTPGILISSVYWMSWFVKDIRMICIESGFIVVNLIAFSLRVLSRNDTLHFEQWPKGPKGFIMKWEKLLRKNLFCIFIVFIAIVAYLFIALLPLMSERITASEAEKYINAICSGTDRDASLLIMEAQNLDTFDAEQNTYDKFDIMNFINRELETEIVEKHITKEHELLEYENLSKWYLSIPAK